jgi:hypothetical protein
VRAVSVTAAEDRGFERGRSEAQAETERMLADAALASTREKEEALVARETELRRETDAKLESRDRAHEEALGRLKAEHAQLLADEDRAALGRIQEIEARLTSEHAHAITREVSAHASTKSDLVDTTSRLHFVEEQKAAGEASRDARIASLESDLGQKTSELSTTQATLQEREAALTETSTRLANTQQVLSIAQADLSAERVKAEKAQAKWLEDKASLERAKDALAAALAQMDEIESRGLD